MPHDKKVNVDTLFDQAHEKQQLGRLPEAEGAISTGYGTSTDCRAEGAGMLQRSGSTVSPDTGREAAVLRRMVQPGGTVITMIRRIMMICGP